VCQDQAVQSAGKKWPTREKNIGICGRGVERLRSSEPTTTVPRAAEGFFPLDEALALDRRSLSPALAREVVWLSGLVAYEQVSEVLERVGGYHIPPSTLWEQVQQHGERLVEIQARQQRQVSIERTRWESREYEAQLRKGLSLDGGMVNRRGEGWKEFKTGVISTLLPPAQQTETQADAVCQDSHYTAVLGSVEQFAPALWALAVEQHVPYAGHVAVTADGAPWIWNLTADLFPCSTQIVDWYHATQHLAEAAQARYPTDAQAAQTWLSQLKSYLIKDEVWRVIAALRQLGLAPYATYFEEHQYRMLYAMFRAEGFPIGAGTIESGVKQYKQRLAGPAMRWSRSGAQRMLVIRSAVLNRSFDQLWLAA
jgi:hypothetical protein